MYENRVNNKVMYLYGSKTRSDPDDYMNVNNTFDT